MTIVRAATLSWAEDQLLPDKVRAALTGPGAPFEMVTEDVLGARMPVFARRPRNARQMLEAASERLGDQPFLIFPDRTFTYRSIHEPVAAVAAGNGHVLDTSHVIFPNGAITLVLILAESHLSIHTWPEEDLIAIDLFSCGGIDGDAVISGLTRSLRLEAVSVHKMARGVPDDLPHGTDQAI